MLHSVFCSLYSDISRRCSAPNSWTPADRGPCQEQIEIPTGRYFLHFRFPTLHAEVEGGPPLSLRQSRTCCNLPLHRRECLLLSTLSKSSVPPFVPPIDFCTCIQCPVPIRILRIVPERCIKFVTPFPDPPLCPAGSSADRELFLTSPS